MNLKNNNNSSVTFVTFDFSWKLCLTENNITMSFTIHCELLRARRISFFFGYTVLIQSVLSVRTLDKFLIPGVSVHRII